MEAYGISLGEMDAKLLLKIEELTLYVIEQEQRMKTIEKENHNLKVLNEKLLELEGKLNKLTNGE